MLHKPAGTLMSVKNLKWVDEEMAFHCFGEQSLCSHQLLGIFYIFAVGNFVLIHVDLHYKCTSSADDRYLLYMSLQKQNQEILKHSNKQHEPIAFVLGASSLKQQALIPNAFNELVNALVLWIRGSLCHGTQSF